MTEVRSAAAAAVMVNGMATWDLSNGEHRVEAAVAVECIRLYLQTHGIDFYDAMGAILHNHQ
jgi:hypothetical protein